MDTMVGILAPRSSSGSTSMMASMQLLKILLLLVVVSMTPPTTTALVVSPQGGRRVHHHDVSWRKATMPMKLSSFASITSNSAATKTTTTTTTTTRLYNIPPPSIDDLVAYKEYASKQPPPASFYELQQDCVRSVRMAIRDGYRLLEVEFPPLPASVLEMDDVSAYDVAQANVRLAVEFGRGLVNADRKKVAIMLPDETEAKIALERYTGLPEDQIKAMAEVEVGITITSLRRSEEGDDRLIKPEQTFLNLFGMGNRAGAVKPLDGTNVYICLVASAQELPDIEELYRQVVLQQEDGEENNNNDNDDDTVPVIILYNLKLDVLRGDLGAPAFPSKDFQDRFLSKVKPVYYLRTRQYSRSTAQPPFLINYQGCLFRAYPGQYQTLLDTGTGRYRRLVGSDVRPALGEFKEQLTQALRDEGVLPQSEGTTFDFLRTGYKTTTWWEEDRVGASLDWKT